MRLTIDTDKHTIEVHGQVKYEEFADFVDALSTRFAWPDSKIVIGAKPENLAMSQGNICQPNHTFTTPCTPTAPGVTWMNTFTN